MGEVVQNPSLDLIFRIMQDIVVDFRALRRPIDLKKLFGRKAPLELEIGFGNGEFLVRLASSRPEHNFLGFEISAECIRKAVKKIEKTGLTNVKLVKMDAWVAIFFLPERCISVTYVNFPDPWPKKKHKKRRFLDEEFLKVLASRTVDGGEFNLATDHEGYLEYVLEQFRSSPYWECDGPEYTLDIPEHFDTKYRRKWENLGKKVYFLRRIKKKHPTDLFELVEEGTEMPHVVIEGNVDLEGKLKDLRGQEHRYENGVVKFLEIFINPERNKALVETIVSEKKVMQKFHVFVATGKETTVRIAERTDVIVTPLIKEAVRKVAEKIGGRILRSTV